MSSNERVQISKRLAAINAASAVFTHLVRISVLIWLQQYLLKRISLEEYMLYPVVASVIVFVPLFTTILTSGLGRFIVEAYAKDDQRRVTQIVSTMFPFLLGAGLILIGLGGAFTWRVGRILTIPPGRLWDARMMMGLLMFSIAIRLPLTPFSMGLFVRQKFVLLNLIGLARELLRMVVLFYLLFAVSPRVLWVVVAAVSTDICNILVLVAISRRLVPALTLRPREIKLARARGLLSFGTWQFLGALAFRIRHNSDVIVLNKLSDKPSVALDVTSFAVGNLFARQIHSILDVVLNPLMPPLTAMHATGRQDRLQKAFLRIGRFSLWLVMFAAVPLMIFSRQLILLYIGPTYVDAAVVLVFSLAVFPVSLGSRLVWRITQATGRVRPMALTAIATQMTNLFFTLYLVGILHMGAVGAAFSSFTVGMLSTVLLVWPLALRTTRVKFAACLTEALTPGLMPTLAGSFVWLVLRHVLAIDTWAQLGLAFAAGAACYLAVLLLFCLQPEDRDDLGRVLSKLRRLANVGSRNAGDTPSQGG